MNRKKMLYIQFFKKILLHKDVCRIWFVIFGYEFICNFYNMNQKYDLMSAYHRRAKKEEPVYFSKKEKKRKK